MNWMVLFSINDTVYIFYYFIYVIYNKNIFYYIYILFSINDIQMNEIICATNQHFFLLFLKSHSQFSSDSREKHPPDP